MTQTLYYHEACSGMLARTGRRLAMIVRHGVGRLLAVQRRACERAQLAELDAAALKDTGLARADILAELRKPVWRR